MLGGLGEGLSFDSGIFAGILERARPGGYCGAGA